VNIGRGPVGKASAVGASLRLCVKSAMASCVSPLLSRAERSTHPP
jgi:hypothetical protein